MSDGPERISLLPSDGWSWVQGSLPYEEDAIEYIRADLIQDAVLAGMRIASSTSIEMVPQAIQDAINEIMGGKNE